MPDAKYPTEFGYPYEEMPVQCSTVDGFCNENDIGRIDLLKVDTEGSELLVLRGAEKMLSQGRVRFVYIEFSTLLPQIGIAGGALVPIAEYLTQFGFEYLRDLHRRRFAPPQGIGLRKRTLCGAGGG